MTDPSTQPGRDDSRKTTPKPDLQPEDAGTEASQQPAPAGAGKAAPAQPAERAMKQEQKTDAERGR